MLAANQFWGLAPLPSEAKATTVHALGSVLTSETAGAGHTFSPPPSTLSVPSLPHSPANELDCLFGGDSEFKYNLLPRAL